MMIGRELTKMHQQVLRGTVSNLCSELREPLRGEVTAVINGGEQTTTPQEPAAKAVWEAICNPTLKPRERARIIAELTGLPSKKIYQQLLRSRDD